MDEFNVNQIGSNLTAVANFYNHRRAELQKKIYSNAFGASNGYIISYLCENEDKHIFQRDIEHEFDLSRSTVSTILKELEKEGLIERKSVIIDARLKKSYLLKKQKWLTRPAQKKSPIFSMIWQAI